MALEGKKILLAVSGGIAAYKINYLVRDLVKRGAEVQVLLTPSAEAFASRVTLSALSQKQVYAEFYAENGTWNSHVEMALWADVMLVAPCTANTLAKMVNGICDNLVIATYLSAKCPVLIAPAMDLDMYAHPTTRENLEKAVRYGHTVIPAEYGALASGLTGEGRLAENSTILQYLEAVFQQPSQSLKGKTVLITAGPTYEAIDPVRFIGNHSSGKMGFCLAEEASKRGARVILISGPTALVPVHPQISLQRVTTAKEMHAAVFRHYAEADIAIMSAAVADYAPKETAPQKIKKAEETLTVELVKNPDILQAMGAQKKHQFLVGFALETHDEKQHAQSKLEKKNLDMIVLNSLRDEGAGFQKETNKISILTADAQKDFPLKSKEEVARDIFDFMETAINKSLKKAL